MEDASATAALLRGIPKQELGRELQTLEVTADGAQALVVAMQVLLQETIAEASSAGPMHSAACSERISLWS